MKRILLIALLTLTCHAAHAQSFGVTLGGRLGLAPNLGNIDTTLGFDVGAELRVQPITVGARIVLSSLLLY